MNKRRALYWLLAGTLLVGVLTVGIMVFYEGRSVGPSTADRARPTCNPLLLLVEGGSRSSDGASIEKLARQLGNEYRGLGVTVSNIDHEPFFDSLYFLGRQQDRAVEFIEKSKHSPIVIVGHSLGAHTAYKIATKMDVSLLVTLDGVSFFGSRSHIPHPGKNVRWIDIDAPKRKGNSPLSPDWDGQNNADISVAVDSDHYDVDKMFGPAKEHVRETLMSCPSALALGEANEMALCKVPGVECNVTWELTDACPEGAIIDVRFFEVDESNSRVDSSKISQINANGTSRFYLRCNSPGHWVCYGAANRPGYHWGVGLDGTQKCGGPGRQAHKNCCAACRAGGVFQAGSLTCS